MYQVGRVGRCGLHLRKRWNQRNECVSCNGCCDKMRGIGEFGGMIVIGGIRGALCMCA